MNWWQRMTIVDVVRIGVTLALCSAFIVEAKSCEPSCAERCASRGYTHGAAVEGANRVCECSGARAPQVRP